MGTVKLGKKMDCDSDKGGVAENFQKAGTAGGRAGKKNDCL